MRWDTLAATTATATWGIYSRLCWVLINQLDWCLGCCLPLNIPVNIILKVLVSKEMVMTLTLQTMLYMLLEMILLQGGGTNWFTTKLWNHPFVFKHFTPLMIKNYLERTKVFDGTVDSVSISSSISENLMAIVLGSYCDRVVTYRTVTAPWPSLVYVIAFLKPLTRGPGHQNPHHIWPFCLKSGWESLWAIKSGMDL